MNKLNFKNNKGPARTGFRGGFTLLEALVAISILMVAVVAPITIAQKGLSSAVYSKNQMIAAYLAQDAIEYIKNVRDENIKSVNDWLNGLDTCKSPDGCQIDTIKNIDSAVIDLGTTPLSTLLINNGFYGYDTDGAPTPTNFTRKIKILVNPFESKTYTNADEALVTVTVSWGTDEVVVKTLIYNY